MTVTVPAEPFPDSAKPDLERGCECIKGGCECILGGCEGITTLNLFIIQNYRIYFIKLFLFYRVSWLSSGIAQTTIRFCFDFNTLWRSILVRIGVVTNLAN